MDNQFNWKTMSSSIIIPRIKEEDKTWGLITRRGVTRYHNYRRPLKNGKGLSFYEVLNREIRQREKEMSRLLFESEFLEEMKETA